MTNAFVVADDLTGAMDTGHGFAANGRSVRVALAGSTADSLPAANADVLAIDANTRDVGPEPAAATVSALFAAAPSASLCYKKIDSTLRGNVVPEVDAALDATDAALAVVAPAFPSTDRVTVDGRHRVDGRPLADAGYGVSTSDLRAIFDASRYDVRSLALETVADGPATVRSALAAAVDAAPRVVVCDAARDRHLRAIALLDRGIASAEDIDEAVKAGFGFRLPSMGIFEKVDQSGVDVHHAIESYLMPELDRGTDPNPVVSELVERGDLGLKTGRGVYDWEETDPEAVVAERDAELLEQLEQYESDD